jgi:hypothetical protein
MQQRGRGEARVFNLAKNLSIINPMRFYGIILDRSLSPAFPPLEKRFTPSIMGDP